MNKIESLYYQIKDETGIGRVDTLPTNKSIAGLLVEEQIEDLALDLSIPQSISDRYQKVYKKLIAH